MTSLVVKTATFAALLWNASFPLTALAGSDTPNNIRGKKNDKGTRKGLNPFRKKNKPSKPVKGMKPIKNPDPKFSAGAGSMSVPDPILLADPSKRMNLFKRKELIAKRKAAIKKMAPEQLKTFVDETNLKKRKKKGVFRKKESTLAQILFPGVAPEEYTEYEELSIMVDLVDSRKTNLPFEYYKLPVCQLGKEEKKIAWKNRAKKNLGEKLMGKTVVVASPYTVSIGETTTCKKVCDLTLSAKQIIRLKRLILRQYTINLSLDGLPVYMFDKNDHAYRGTPLGSMISDASGKTKYFYHNHFRFIVQYNVGEGYENARRIVGFRVKPISIDHSGDLSTCGTDTINNHIDTLLELDVTKLKDKKGKVTHSYEVFWEETDIAWADRWDVYLRGRPDDSIAHHMSIINSFMVVVFLGAVLSVILIKNLRKDIAIYNELTDDDEEDETGWKLVHGDVFRPPTNQPLLFAVLIGTGAQIFVAVICTLLLGLTNMLNPMQKGQALSNAVILYVFTGTVSGYVSARLYKFCGGKNWKVNTICTALAFPGMLVTLFLMLNLFLSLYGSAMAVSIWTIIALFLLWSCVAAPLVCVGSFAGFKVDTIKVPTRTNQINRAIPHQQSYLASPIMSFVVGVMPFSTVCIEVYFIMGAIWMHQYYYLMGYLFGGCFLLALTCALLSTVLCYMRLCAEDHRWWWKAFFDSATSGFWLFMYSVWYLCAKLHLVGFLPVTVYLTYMAMLSLAFGLFCGSVGFLSCLLFTRTIYGAVKVD